MTNEELVVHQNKFIGVYTTMFNNLVLFANVLCEDKDVPKFMQKLDVLILDTQIQIHNLTVDLKTFRNEDRKNCNIYEVEVLDVEANNEAA